MNKKWRQYGLIIISFLSALLVSITLASPSDAHWADLAVAEILVGERETQITLTFPTGLVASADDNRDNQLSADEVRIHQEQLKKFLASSIRLRASGDRNPILTVKPSQTAVLPPNLKATAGTHSTLLLVYTWPKPVQIQKIDYNLFLPGVPTAHCLAIVLQSGRTQNYVFTPKNQQLELMEASLWQSVASVSIAIVGAFIWGAMHALSPGHGKTIVGAYLAGSRATPQHALFLGLTATLTHTAGVFALGLVALFASHFILPEQVYPWLSLISGLMVVAIGLKLFVSRMGRTNFIKMSFKDSNDSARHSHHHHHYHDRSHHHHHDHHHDHSHIHTHDRQHHHHHDHSHLPPGAEGSEVTWRSLLALGISGGLVPCPSALVVLLSAIALGQIGFGLVLVLAFSLGLAGVLSGLGLLLVCAKRLFEQLPTPKRVVRVLPSVSALFVALLGLGITAQALVQIGLVKL